MRLPSRLLTLPRCGLRALRGWLTSRRAIPDSPHPLEHDLSSAADPIDQDSVPTKRESVRAKALVPGPPVPPHPFPEIPPPAPRRRRWLR